MAATTTDRYDDDAATVRRVVAGDVDAFESLVRRWQGPLVNLAYRYCRNHGEAEELAQEAFLKIFKGLPKWRQDSRLSTWLYAVAANHYRSALRGRRPYWGSLDDHAHAIAGADGARQLDAYSRDEVVRRAVASLPPKYRDVTVLFYFNDMDLQETARICKLRPGTVKARLHRARKLLEAKLSPPVPAAAEETAR